MSDEKAAVILPGQTIGILGGGQLGRMLATAGRHMGYRFVCLDPGEDSACGQVCDHQVVAGFEDIEAARELARLSDVVTYEFENVSPAVMEALSEEVYVPQGSELLSLTRHRSREKEAIEKAGAEVAPYRNVVDEASLQEALKAIGAPGILKTATGGYDGKGQRVLGSPSEGAAALAELGAKREFVYEKFVSFELELSVVVARSTTGEMRAFEPAENVHVDNILHLSIAPARVTEEIKEKARQLALQIAESMDMVGLLGVEMFLTDRGELLINELAPRPHNSGHFTMDACWTSQFEQHLRAICGLPLGNPGLHTPVVMANLLGEHVDLWLEACQKETPEQVIAKTHLYGKKGNRRGRKMGHVNVLAGSVEEALAWMESSAVWKDRNRGEAK